jgi:hypothetical protein
MNVQNGPEGGARLPTYHPTPKKRLYGRAADRRADPKEATP